MGSNYRFLIASLGEVVTWLEARTTLTGEWAGLRFRRWKTMCMMLPPRDEVIAEMEAEAAKNRVPIVGPAVARVLYQLAMMIGAKNVFEMGSAIGYSTIWWARAV